VSAAVLIVVLRMWASDGRGDMRGACPVTVRDRRKTLHGSAGQAAGRLGLRLVQLRYSVNKLRRSIFKDYHKF
jgi:hypothetical protein